MKFSLSFATFLALQKLAASFGDMNIPDPDDDGGPDPIPELPCIMLTDKK